MAISDSHRRLRDLASGERGFALPTALLAMVISFMFAGAAVLASVTAQQGTARDHEAKEAVAAADAGASVALLRLNKDSNALNSSTPCLGVSGNTLVATGASGDGWCPEISGSVSGATYAYRVSPQGSGGTLSIVATGKDGKVSRRIDIVLKGTTAGSVLAAEGLIGREGITFSGNANIRVGVGTNGNLETSGNTSICNNIRHGVGKQWSHSGNASQCKGYTVTEGNEALPEVSTFMPPTIATNNSDYRLVKCTKESPVKEPSGCQSDTYSGGSWTATNPWNPETRAISASGNTTLTLGGGDYWVCSLTLSGNSHLIMAAGAIVRLFFDTPEHCNLSGSQISLSGNTNIESSGYQPKLGEFEVPGFYLLGSPTVSTSVNLSGNIGTNEFVIYAPNSAINVSGNANYVGVIAGKSVNSSGNGEIYQDSGFEPPKIGGATVYSRESYVQCVGASASPPNANC